MVLFYIGLLAVFVMIFIYAMRQKEEGERYFGHPYLLDDSNFERNDEGEVRDDRIEKWTIQGAKYQGYAVTLFPREAELRSLNPTTSPGGTTGIYIGLLFQLGKWEWLGRVKADEWIEVSPTFAQYYQITLRQKEEMETRIKQGLASAAQSVADLELLKHDHRKYREFLEYFGLEYDETGKWRETGTKDEHALRAVFIDMVDAHTGEGIAIRSIVQRWPTLIVDFQKLSDGDIDVDKIKDKLNVSKAEAVVLSTKNRLYIQWKRLFEPEVKARYERIQELVKSREESVKQYREWLKPVIARHKMLEEGLSSAGERAKFKHGEFKGWLSIPGQATAITNVTIWAWHWVTLPELEKGGTERQAIEESEKRLRVDDEWTRRELIFHPEHGLIRKYGWITPEWVTQKAAEVWKNVWLIRQKLYYAFVRIDFIRNNLRSASGEEIEDTIFQINGALFSRNVMFVKLLELLAKQEDFNRYVDNLIGVRHEVPLPTGKPMEIKTRFAKLRASSRRFLDFFSLNVFRFMKHGPYERDFAERMTKYWLRAMSQGRYEPIVRFIKDKIGMGVN